MATSPELPKSIRIGPITYKVNAWTPAEADAQDPPLFGSFDANRGVINILYERHCAAARLDTVLHEVSHAICWVYKIKPEDSEERIVSTLGTALAQVLIDNPDLRSFIEQSCPDATEQRRTALRQGLLQTVTPAEPPPIPPFLRHETYGQGGQ